MRSGIPNSVATKLAADWAQQPSVGDLDERIAEIEASNLARLNKIRPDRFFWLLGGQIYSAASTETRIRETRDFVWLRQEFEVQGAHSRFLARQIWLHGYAMTFPTFKCILPTTSTSGGSQSAQL
jgi:hypothetical protein